MTLKVAHKLAVAFAVVTGLALALAVFQIMQMSSALRVMRALVENDVALIQQVRDVAQRQERMRNLRESGLTDALIAQSRGIAVTLGDLPQRYTVLADQMHSAVDALKGRADERANVGVTEGRRRVWADAVTAAGQVAAALGRLNQAGAEQAALLARGDITAAIASRDRLDQLRMAAEDRIGAFDAIVRQLGDSGREDLEKTYGEAVRVAVAGTVLMITLALLVAYMIGRSISGRLGRSMAFVTGVGGGDLTRTLAIAGDDELGQLGTHLNAMVGNLRSVAVTTRAAAENVHAATAQIRASTQQQAASVAEQLAAVEQTTATLSEITESGAQINRRAQDIQRGAQATIEASRSGLRAVDDTNQAMDGIREQAEAVAENIVLLSERTQAIGEIIVTVNDIAERSHLLALNAAIEAAAAGEHGRTFAVVAGEIKSLADQAKEATAQVRSNLSEIQHGINASVMLTEEAVKRIAAGKRQTDASQATIRGMAENIQESVQAFQQIVAGTNQQQIGLEQVIQALQNIRQASSQTAAGTRQLEDAAGNLNQLGGTLVNAVRNYRV